MPIADKAGKGGFHRRPSNVRAGPAGAPTAQFGAGSSPQVTRWYPEARAASLKYNIPVNVLLALIDEESSGNENTPDSPTGAFGLTQFEPSTAASYGVKRGTSKGAVKSQINGAAAYLKDLGFESDPQLALAKYNAGPGNPQAGLSYASQVLGKSHTYSAGADLGLGGYIAAAAEKQQADAEKMQTSWFQIGRIADFLSSLTSIDPKRILKVVIGGIVLLWGLNALGKSLTGSSLPTATPAKAAAKAVARQAGKAPR